MLIAIAAGHGSETAGKRTPDGYREHWANTRMAYFFDEAAKRHNVKTLKVGWDDTNSKDDPDVSISKRQSMIKAAKCDYSFDFHCNAFGYGEWNDANGICTYIHSTNQGTSKSLAKLVQAELVKGTKQKDRGVNTGQFGMVNCVSLGVKAAVLIEAAFMTNKVEAELIKDDKFLKETAEEAFAGFCKFIGIKYIKEEDKVVESEAKPVVVSTGKVKILANVLNVRKEGSMSAKVVTSVKRGEVYTIVEKKNGWGKLKSGAGWINLNDRYVEFI